MLLAGLGRTRESLIGGTRLRTRVEHRRVRGHGRIIHLLGVCQGLEGEAEAVTGTLEEEQPVVVALALDPELAPRFAELGPAESLGPEDEAYARGLSEWGEVQLPSPEFRAAIRAAEAIDATVVGIDLPEDEYLDAFTDNVGVLALVKRAVRARIMRSFPPSAEDPAAYCRRFDARLNQGVFARLERRREHAMARRVAELPADADPAVVVEIQRVEGLEEALELHLDGKGPP